MKKIIVGIMIVIIIVIAYVSLKGTSPHPGPIQDQTLFDARNSTFKIEGAPVTLVNGVAEIDLDSIPRTTVTTRYFGNEMKHDLDNDGREDAVFVVTQDGGGSGTFFYVVAVLDTINGRVGSDSYPLGDRITPQSITIDEGMTTRGTHRDNVIVVDYTVRKADEPMTTAPSVDTRVWLKLDPSTLQFGEVEQNFEG